LFDSQDCPDGLTNYWGYCPVSFFAPHQNYCVDKDPLAALDEFRDMVKALHQAGIEVILDVVYNHTAEGNETGPVYGLKGIDNSIYYLLEKDRSKYSNYTGTGNTLNANHPVVRRMITDSLHFWVNDMHVDGFRFDLASILARDESGKPLINPPVLWDIDTDPVLAGIKLIAEAWDAAGLYQVGTFIGDRWKEWNGRFRDDVRRFMRGDNGTVSSFASRLLGSPDLYGHEMREPEQSINFITCHDGFTLNDLVSYKEKHNNDNNESNRDGSNDNLSWNCGVEGPSDEPSVEALRSRQVRNFLTITLLSVGAPMLLMGDEVRRTQEGNNNAYCQDNPVSWFNWSLFEKNADLHRFVKMIIAARLERDTAMTEFNMSLQKLLKHPHIIWHGVNLHQPDWSFHSHSIGLTLHSLSGNSAMHWMINAHSEPLAFEMPRSFEEVNYRWTRWIDTALHSPEDINTWNEGPLIPEKSYTVASHSLVILVAAIQPKRVVSSVPG
jgi:glycogen operon protein